MKRRLGRSTSRRVTFGIEGDENQRQDQKTLMKQQMNFFALLLVVATMALLGLQQQKQQPDGQQ